MRRVVVVVLIALLLAPDVSVAAPCARVVPTDTPCDGLAWPIGASKRAASAIASVEALRAEVTACERKRDADAIEALQRLRACDDACARKIGALRLALMDTRAEALRPKPVPWYRSPWIWAVAGGTLGGVSAWYLRGSLERWR